MEIAQVDPSPNRERMGIRKWAVLIRTYTEHKLVVTRLNGFMAVESTENRKKMTFFG